MRRESAEGPTRYEQGGDFVLLVFDRARGDPIFVRSVRARRTTERARRLRVIARERFRDAWKLLRQILPRHRVLLEVVADADALVVDEREERRLRDVQIRHVALRLAERLP